LACLALASGLFACAAVEGSAHAGPPAAAVQIPFLLTDANNISIRAKLNAIDPVDLMFHTGVDSVSLTKTAIAKLSSFTASDSIAVRSWGGTTQARQGAGNSLQIGDLDWRDLWITESENSGTGTDGKFGPNLFAGKIVEINFDSSELVIRSTLPALEPGYERLDLEFRHGGMFVTGALTVGELDCTTEFMLHTGFGGTALLDEQFVSAHALADKLETLSETTLEDSYGNTVKTRKVRLPKLRLGATAFTDVPVGIFDGAIGTQRMSLVGGALLKRFNLILDVEKQHVYLRPSRWAGAPFGS
jgi:predicted aspartyl protease